MTEEVSCQGLTDLLDACMRLAKVHGRFLTQLYITVSLDQLLVYTGLGYIYRVGLYIYMIGLHIQGWAKYTGLGSLSTCCGHLQTPCTHVVCLTVYVCYCVCWHVYA